MYYFYDSCFISTFSVNLQLLVTVAFYENIIVGLKWQSLCAWYQGEWEELEVSMYSASCSVVTSKGVRKEPFHSHFALDPEEGLAHIWYSVNI